MVRQHLSAAVLHRADVACAGIRGAYDGLTAALLRALTYSTFRFGAYEVVKTKWLPKDPSMISMLGASAAAGGFAGLLGVPAGMCP